MEKQLILFNKSPCQEENGCIERAVGVKPATRTFRYVNHQNGNLTMGIWDCLAGQWETPAHPHHELCAIIEGEASITDASGTHIFGAGDTFVIPQGARISWHVPRYVKKIFVVVKGMEDLV